MVTAKTIVPLSLILLLLTTLSTSCDPREFDDLADTTWVRATSAPEAAESRNYALNVAAGTTSSASATVYVAGSDPNSISQLSYSESGEITSKACKLSDASSLIDSRKDIEQPPMAVDTTKEQNIVILGNTNGRITIGNVETGDCAERNTGANDPVTAIALGKTTIDANNNDFDKVDLVIATKTTLTVLIDYGDFLAASSDITTQARSCTLTGASNSVISAIAIGDFWGQGDKIVIGRNGGSTSGLLYSIDPSAFGDPVDNVVCVTPDEITGTTGDFGASIISGDFNNDNNADLAVSSPSAEKVFVYLNGLMNPTEIGFNTNTQSFGSALAAGDMDKSDGDELVIGDSNAEVDGKKNAGVVYILNFKGSDNAPDSSVKLHDSEPEADQLFGRTAALSPWGDDHLLVVGAKNQVYTYWKTPLSGDNDLRSP